MCLAVPMQVVQIDKGKIIAQIDGARREASLMMFDEPIETGDFVLVHAGFVISKIDKEEARLTLELMREAMAIGVR